MLRLVLEQLRKGRIAVVKVTRSGPRRRYSYLNLPVGTIERYGLRYNVLLGDGYVEYVADTHGVYVASKAGNTYRIRLPVDASGYVIVEFHDRGFRVYY